MAVHDCLHRHLPRIADAGTLDLPEGFLIQRFVFQFGIRCFIQAGGHFGAELHGASLRQLQFTAFFTHHDIVCFELHEMTVAIAHIIAADADGFTPSVVIQPTIQLHIRAAQAYALTVDAGEIRLPADARAVADVQRVIPDV